MLCWPTFALAVACCPKPETVAPEVVRCPTRPEDVEEHCCSPELFNSAFREFGSLTQAELVHIAPPGKHVDALVAIRDQLFQFVRDIGILNVHAWRLLSTASARAALAEVDNIKDLAVQRKSVDDLREVWRRALLVSRALGRALFRIENFQQFLVGHIAHKQGQLQQGFNLEQIREDFSPLMEAYVTAAREHDFLAYTLIPSTEKYFRQAPQVQAGLVVNLMVVSLGAWAKTGITTIWTVLKRASCHLRVFVLGDAVGLQAWRSAIAELAAQEGPRELLRKASFEYVDYMAQPRFKAYLRRYPKSCKFGDAGTAILARVVCHEVLPLDVDRVISMDLGDIIVLGDIAELWNLGDGLGDEHLLAAADAVALHHVNGGLVLYDVRRMRDRNFSATTLRAVRDGLRMPPDGLTDMGEQMCLRDQSIINILHSFREKFGYPGPSPVMLLPCKWSVFPAPEWQPNWNSPDEWLTEITERRRYPGLVSGDRLEVYCPDEADLLSAWAYVPMTEVSAEGQTRQSRLRVWAHHGGTKKTRYCSSGGVRLGERCCRCGEAAALVHVAGDMKRWPAMRSWLHSHAAPWSEPAPEDALMRASSRKWWGGDQRLQSMTTETGKEAFVVAKHLGLNAKFDRCATIRTNPVAEAEKRVMYHQLDLHTQLPVDVHVDFSAPRDAYILIGIGGHSGLEMVLGHEDAGTAMQLRVIRSTPEWVTRGDLARFPHVVLSRRKKVAADRDLDANEAAAWTTLRFKVGHNQQMEIDFRGQNSLNWQFHLPEQIFWMFRHVPLSLSVASQTTSSHWGVCLGDPP